MEPYNKRLVTIFSILISLILFIYILSESESVYPIASSFELGKLVGHSTKFIALGFIIYKFIEGIIVSDKKLILRNLLILFIVNVMIYSVIFFTSPIFSSRSHQIFYRIFFVQYRRIFCEYKRF